MSDERTVRLIDHHAGKAFLGTFRPVYAIGRDCVAGVTEIETGDTVLFVATILHDGRVLTYHDWQAPSPEEIAAYPHETGRWYDNESDTPAIWLDGLPMAFADHAAQDRESYSDRQDREPYSTQDE